MAGQDRAQSNHLSLFRTAAANARRFGFFALLRAAEARASALPRVGRSRTPAQNVATLAEAPALGFPETTLDSIGFDRAGRARVEGRFLGLTGPMGPLPLHLTEYAIYERRYGKARPFGRFLDLLAERMLQFFYRAWADSQPLAHADRPEDDRFAGYLAALSGAGEGAGEDSALPLRARLHYAGLFAGRRSASALQDGLSHLLGTAVTLREFRTRWRDIEPEDRTRLGRTGAFNALGRDAVLGGRVCSAEDAFQVVVKARSMAEYADLLPSGRRYAIAAEALTAFAPSHLDWEIELEIDEAAATSARLDGAAALGWTSWAAIEGRPHVRADARLRRGADIRRPAA
jgi:type VI secretion system ImpH/TssG family protein